MASKAATTAAATGSQLHSVAFIGAGTMGGRVATRVMATGFSVTVCDRSERVQKAFAANGAALAATPKDCASADVVIIFVMDGPQAIDVALGEQGLVHGIDPDRPPTVLIMSTIHPEDAKTIATGLEAKGAPVLDVPVTGVPTVAEQGQLLLLVGGRDEDVDRVRPLLEFMGREFVRCGPLGSGLTAKILNNMLGTSNLYLMQECYRLGVRYGLAPDMVASILENGAGQNYWTHDVDRAFATFDVLSGDEDYFLRMMGASLKDWRFAQRLADAEGMRLPFVSAMTRAVEDEPGPELWRQWRDLVKARRESPRGAGEEAGHRHAEGIGKPVSIEQQVRELVDRTQIEQLVTQYAHAVRRQDVDVIMSLFVDAGASVDFESAIEGTTDTQGTEEVKKVYEKGFADLQPWPVLANHLIEFQSPTEASGEVLLEFRTGKKDYQVAWIGVYHDTYVKRDGVWKFKNRKATITHTPTLEAAPATRTSAPHAVKAPNEADPCWPLIHR